MTTIHHDTRQLAPPMSPRRGNGIVQLVEFADFQCPYCRQIQPPLAELVHAGRITLVYRYFPLIQSHPNAVVSAHAAAAAERQDAFWPMHDLLFKTQPQWESLTDAQARDFFAGLAGQIDLDVGRWSRDLDSDDVTRTVEADLDVAMQLQLPGTPSMFVDGDLYRGPLSRDALFTAVERADQTFG